MERLDLRAEEIAYIGDDVNDLEVMKMVGVSICPADAIFFVKDTAQLVCESNGGKGCFRETAEKIILAQQGIKISARTPEVIKLNSGVKIGPGEPCYIIAEIGINHNGSLEIAKQLIDEAVTAHASAVQFQK